MLLDTRYPEVVANAVQQMAHDLNWYKAQYEEAKKVIAQLHRGYALPGEPTYIHPADLAELAQKSLSVMDVYRGSDDKCPFIITHTGQRFQQSALMPQITKNFQ